MAKKKSRGTTKKSNGKPAAGKSKKSVAHDDRLSEDYSPLLGADGPYPYAKRMPKREYEDTLLRLQIELVKVQQWVKESQQKVAIVFEGRDAAGKGGTIKRFREHMNPRGARVVALLRPNETQEGQWYFQRYVSELPTTGEVVFFDRSWYNRAGVEPVMGFCTADQYQRFMHQVPDLERALVESGLWLFKLWFDVGQIEQSRRIEAREMDPLKQWKVSPMDYESMKRWEAYTRARNVMLFFTDTPYAPWTVIRSDDKRRARIGALRSVLSRLPYPDKDTVLIGEPDPLVVGAGESMFPQERRHLFDVGSRDKMFGGLD